VPLKGPQKKIKKKKYPKAFYGFNFHTPNDKFISNCKLWVLKLGRARALKCHILETSQVYSYGHEVT
jgi:hypothetical protein